MAIRYGMHVLYVRDLDASIAFYRLLGLDVPDPHPDRPVSACRLGDGVTLLLTTGEIARRFDDDWTAPDAERPSAAYAQVTEFFVDDNESVDTLWRTLTDAGHHGRTAPGRLLGPYAAMVDDPDGNVILITHEPAHD